MAMYIQVEVRDMSDLILIQYYSIKDSWAYLDAREVKCLD
jgi:hypothetical protein